MCIYINIQYHNVIDRNVLFYLEASPNENGEF